MIYVSTIFDYNHAIKANAKLAPGQRPYVPRPVISVILNSTTGEELTIPLFVKGYNLSAASYFKGLKKLARIFSSGLSISCNDAKAHADNLNIGFDMSYQISSRVETLAYDGTKTVRELKALCQHTCHMAAQSTSLPWQNMLGNAGLIYAMLQRRGVYDGVRTNYPIYSFISSGRISTSNYNIMGATKDDIILSHNRLHTKFIRFDWIAADFRAGSIISKDPDMMQAFVNSDPYTTISECPEFIITDEETGEERSVGLTIPDPDTGEERKLTRDECKKGLFRGVYDLDPTHPMVMFYDRFREWMENSIAFLKENGYLASMLGRKFYIQGEPSDDKYKSVFNAVLQGTVAHALHCVLWQIYHHFPDNFLTDMYDGVIMTADEGSIPSLIKHVGNIMFKPFQYVLENEMKDITFPLKVEVGDRWGKYEEVKVIR